MKINKPNQHAKKKPTPAPYRPNVAIMGGQILSFRTGWFGCTWDADENVENISKCILLHILSQQANSEEVPHLLLTGPAGSGKMTRARAFIRKLFGGHSLKVIIIFKRPIHCTFLDENWREDFSDSLRKENSFPCLQQQFSYWNQSQWC